MLSCGSTTYLGYVVSFDVSKIDCDENIFGVVINPDATDNWGGPYLDIAGSHLDFRTPSVSGGVLHAVKAAADQTPKAGLHSTLL